MLGHQVLTGPKKERSLFQPICEREVSILFTLEKLIQKGLIQNAIKFLKINGESRDSGASTIRDLAQVTRTQCPRSCKGAFARRLEFSKARVGGVLSS